MATLLTTDELKRHIETDLDDDILQQYLDANEDEIVKRYGPNYSDGDRTEYIVGNGTDSLILSHPAESITSIVEHENGYNTTLAADDYILRKPMIVERLNTGTNPRVIWPSKNTSIEGYTSSWPSAATVVYTPKNYDNRRRIALINLCKVDMSYTGSRLLGIGDYRETNFDDSTLEKERILQSLINRGVPFG